MAARGGTRSGAGRGREVSARAIAKRVLVRLVLVASIAPVILLGPTSARAPMKLVRELAVRHPVSHVRFPGACAICA